MLTSRLRTLILAAKLIAFALMYGASLHLGYSLQNSPILLNRW